jgi:hypothetical protein
VCVCVCFTQKHWCCTKSLADSGKAPDLCNADNIDHLIIRNKDLRLKNIKFAANSNTATAHGLNSLFPITSSGPHLLVMSNCDPRLTDMEVTFSGKSIWMNPYGYLPATSYYFMPFYGSMAVIYGVLALLWLILNVIYWKDIVTLQNYITCVLAVCLIENMVLYFDYANFNSSGQRHTLTLVFGVLLSVARRSISRMLIMAVSIGFAIVRPDLGKNRNHILNFGLVYFCLALAQQILVDLAKVHTGISDHWRMLLSIPVAVADSGCYWFIFISLYHLIAMLRVRQQVVKLTLYKSFTKVLAFSLVGAVVFSIYHLYLVASKQVISHWRIWWLMDEAIWNMLFAVIFLAVLVLFRPSQSAKRYAYTQVSTEMAEDEYGLENGIEMVGSALQDEGLFSLGDDDDILDSKTAKVE